MQKGKYVLLNSCGYCGERNGLNLVKSSEEIDWEILGEPVKQGFRSKEEVCIEAVRKAKKIAEQKVDAVHFLSAQSYEPLITGGT